ncbi:hypothetical protein DMUE_2662 [Dictyocoela muelleri]|nr:hypothetical protein DMUE_2662 [Dictyocoela muelleri]
MTNFKIIKSQRGKEKMIYDGYIYVFDRKNIHNLSWRCATHSCKGRISTDFDKIKVLKSKTHFHERETVKITRLLLNESMKDTAINTQIPFMNAFIAESLKLEKDEKKNIGNVYSLRDYYNRLRKIQNPPIVNHNEDILQMYRLTNDCNRFLQYDSGKDDDSRIIIFYTDELIKLFSRTNCILCDGTLKTSPRGFSQLLVIHIMFFNKRIPVVYALMKRKDIYSYEIIFSELKKRISNYEEYLVTDFEL